MRRGKGGPGDAEEPWLADLLRAEADRHEPDLEAVRRRVAVDSGPGAGPPPVPGRGRRAAWAAAGFLVATAAGSLAVAGMSDVLLAGGHSGPVRVVPSTGAPGAGRGGTEPTPHGPPSATDPAAGATPTPAGTPTATGTPVATSVTAGLEVRPVGPGHAVDLSDARNLDWVVAGSRPDGTAVRRRTGGQVIGAPHVVGDPRTATAAGPFRTSWTGGMPDATGSRVGTWLTVHGRPGGPRTGFVVSAPAGASLLTLYVGAGAPGAQVTVAVEGRERDVAPLPAARDGGPAGHVVTIRLDGSGAGQVVARVDAPDGGVVAFAAAAVR
jgi:hypothetical protein